MQLREDLQLQTAIRALVEVIAPAVDAGNALAVEQTQLVIGMLQLMAARLPLQYQYDCDELARLVSLGRALGGQDDRLAMASAAGEEVLGRAQATPQELLAAIRKLRDLSGAVITAAYRDGDHATRTIVSRHVLAHAEQQLLRERAWFAPQGWELQPESLPDIEILL